MPGDCSGDRVQRADWLYRRGGSGADGIVSGRDIPAGAGKTAKRDVSVFGSDLFDECVFYSGEHCIWSWWIFRLSREGIRQGAMVVVHLVLILVFCMVLTITTEPMEITHGLEELLSPLSKVGVPTEEIAMILGVAMQFIPVLGEEAETIRMAQTARGARFESKKLTERAASFLPLVIPVFLAAFRRADELACAMEARGYRGPGRRTKKKKSLPNRNGNVAIAASAIF